MQRLTITSPRRRPRMRWLARIVLLALIGLCLWLAISINELRTGRRLWPWSAYAFCGASTPAALPQTVRIGLYEEFPNPWRLAKLAQLDFPVTLAIAAPSRAEFERLQAEILQTNPEVREVLFWPTLTQEEGYYPGGWSAPEGVNRAIRAVGDLPALWDLELPRGGFTLDAAALQHWWANRQTLHDFFSTHTQPIHLWRTHTAMGLDPAFLRLAAIHFDPLDYPSLRLHLDLYAIGEGRPAAELRQILRCGVERYGPQFIPSLGVLNDGEGPDELFTPVATFERDLRLARESGAAEIWLFGANGLNAEYLAALRRTIPLEPLPAPAATRP